MNKTVCMSINICIWLLWIITMPRQENNPRIKDATYVITKIWIVFILTIFLEYLIREYSMSSTRYNVSSIQCYFRITQIAMIKDFIGYGM